MAFEPEPIPFRRLGLVLPDACPPPTVSFRKPVLSPCRFAALDDAATWVENHPLAPMWINLGLAVGNAEAQSAEAVGLRVLVS